MNESSPVPRLEPDRSAWPADHPPVSSGKIGVLLLNLGTPDGTTYWPMRRYLREFLSDRRDRYSRSLHSRGPSWPASP